MSSSEIRAKFLKFFEKRGHAIVPSSSLVPDDPSVLLTTAGMQQFKPYFTGERDPMKDFGSKNTASIQKSFRTSDIDEVGDESHLTFFEMLGNFSFGGYFKKDAIEYAHEFITKEMGLPISFVTVFEGSHGVPKDTESREIWKSLGVDDIREQGIEDVFWGPTGSEGPCGPTTEIYCENKAGGRAEIWNIVFNEFMCHGSREMLFAGEAKLTPLTTKGIDTGMGLERLAMISQNKSNIFETDLFVSVIPDEGLPTILGENVRRMMLDHGRAVAFLISDGVMPSNKQQGYVLRRLIRRMMAHFHKAARGSFAPGDISGFDFVDIEKILRKVVAVYKSTYSNLDEGKVTAVFYEENTKYRNALNRGLRELAKIEFIDAAIAFRLYESFGLTYEIIKDFAPERSKNLNQKHFEKEMEKHQEISRAGSEAKFGGHGLILNTGELKAANEEEVKIVTRLHTATHLLQQALRDVLGTEVRQAGSDITAERTRFDFTFGRKLTPEEVKQVEARVNEKIKEDLPVTYVELPRAEAEKTGALFFFKAKYGDVVKVYYMGKNLETAWSKEFCGGPHVSHTNEVGKFKIAKEEAVSAGIRRIRGTVE